VSELFKNWSKLAKISQKEKNKSSTVFLAHRVWQNFICCTNQRPMFWRHTLPHKTFHWNKTDHESMSINVL